MESVTRPSVAEKRGFYRQADVAETYDRKRFGGASGAWVNERELAEVLALLPPTGRVLDLGCGTGRVSQRLLLSGRDVVMLDSSAAMLARARPIAAAPAVLGDAFALPFAPESFDAIVALRVAFHFAEFDALTRSVAPLLRAGGRFVFDTYRWTPRAVLALASKSWGGKVYTHAPGTIASAGASEGLQVAASRPCFLFSPYVYRLLPLNLVRTLDRLEAHIPASGRARVFWALEKAPVASPPAPPTRGDLASLGRTGGPPPSFVLERPSS